MMKKSFLKLYLTGVLFAALTAPCFGFTEHELSDGLLRMDRLELRSSGRFSLVRTLEKALNFYDSLSDYKTRFLKTEKVKGALGPTEQIYLKFEKSFKIYMRWLNTDKEGVEVVYERGKNKGKLAVHKPGLLFGLAPVIFLDQNSPWVREGSASYNIEDAGIGSFLYDFTEQVIKASRENKLRADYLGKATEEGLSGERAEVTFIDSKPDSGYLAYRVRILFDGITNLPVKMELFDWQNEPMGIYTYKDLQFNLGEEDAEFKNQINDHLLKVYNSK